MTTERWNCLFKHYPEHVELSKARRGKYWDINSIHKVGKGLLKRIENKECVMKPKGVNNKLYLFDTVANEFVLRNKKSVGTPHIVPINSQMVWEGGNTNVFRMRTTKNFLHEWFKPGIVRQLPEKIMPGNGYFIHLEYIFYYPFSCRTGPYQDYINHLYIRAKVFEDTLVSLGVIEDDSPRYLRGGYGRYVDIPTEEDRRLEIKIHFCKNNQRIM